MTEVRLGHPDLPADQTIPGVVLEDGRVVPNLADAGWCVIDAPAPETPADEPVNDEQGATSLDPLEGEE